MDLGPVEALANPHSDNTVASPPPTAINHVATMGLLEFEEQTAVALPPPASTNTVTTDPLEFEEQTMHIGFAYTTRAVW